MHTKCPRTDAGPAVQVHQWERGDVMFARSGRLERFMRSEDGPTAVEYAILIAVICVAVIGALSSFGVHMDAIYTNINSTVPTGAAS